MGQLTRRQFLKITASTFGAAGAAQFLPGTGGLPLGLAAPGGAAGATTVTPTFCEMCFWKCSGLAHVRDGRLWKFEGNPLDPQSRGRLCPRGTGAVGAVYDPSRLRQPLIRTGERGKEQWKTASWEEALDHVAAKMKKIAAEHGPESIALFSHGTGGGFFRQVTRAYGCVNQTLPSFAQCKGPRDVGWELTIGSGLGSPEPVDIINTDCLVLIGSHLGENMHNTQVQEFAEIVGRRAPVIVVDPRFSVAASKAKFWLPIKPGTDTALVLGWMNMLVAEGRYDRAFVETYGHGFDKFVAAIKDYTPEWAATETGLDPALIRAAAREFSTHRPRTIVHPGRRTNWYGDDTQRSRAVALLNMLLGNYGRRGGFYLATNVAIPGYPKPKPPAVARGRADNPDKRYPFADEVEGLTTGVREATITGKPYPIKGWIVYGTDLMQNLPNIEETKAAIDKLDLLVVVDTMPCDIAGYADVVLPESVFFERHDDLFTGWGRQGWITLRQPAIKPPHDQKPGWWITKQLADRLGVGDSAPWGSIEEYLAWRAQKAGLSFDELKKNGVVMGPKTPVFVDDGAALEFTTESGKVEFWSEHLEKLGFDPVPKYKPPEAGPPGALRLITGRAPVHTFSRTQSNPLLSDLMPVNEAWVHPSVAQAAGLVHGARVKLRNQDGVETDPVRVKVTQRIRPDCVYMIYGFGHSNPMRKGSYRVGASVARLTTRYKVDPLMGGTSLHSNFVTLVKES
jgi:thiosulfate reductase / polysulfide reductase chain A